jgi:hypothetical protein
MRRFYFHASMSCAATRQTLRMDADNDGKLTALDHRTKTTSSTFDVFLLSFAVRARCELSMCLQTKVRILLFPVALLCCAINAKTCLAQLPACASEMPDDRSTH